MNNITLSHIKNWQINYSTYVDTLRLFNKNIYAKQTNELETRNYQRFTVVYGKDSKDPILFEMKNASNYLGEVDNLSKEAIIQRVIGYIESHAR